MLMAADDLIMSEALDSDLEAVNLPMSVKVPAKIWPEIGGLNEVVEISQVGSAH